MLCLSLPTQPFLWSYVVSFLITGRNDLQLFWCQGLVSLANYLFATIDSQQWIVHDNSRYCYRNQRTQICTTRVVSNKCTPGFAYRAFSDTTLLCFIVNEHTTKCSHYKIIHHFVIKQDANWCPFQACKCHVWLRWMMTGCFSMSNFRSTKTNEAWFGRSMRLDVCVGCRARVKQDTIQYISYDIHLISLCLVISFWLNCSFIYL